MEGLVYMRDRYYVVGFLEELAMAFGRCKGIGTSRYASRYRDENLFQVHILIMQS